MQIPHARISHKLLGSGTCQLDSNDSIPKAVSKPEKIVSSELVNYSMEQFNELVIHFVMPLGIPKCWELTESKEYLEYFVDSKEDPLLMKGVWVKKRVELKKENELKWVGSIKGVLSETESLQASVTNISASGTVKQAQLFLADVSQYEIMSWLVSREEFKNENYPNLLLTRDLVCYPIRLEEYYVYALKSRGNDIKMMLGALSEFTGYTLAPSKAIHGLYLLQKDLYDKLKEKDKNVIPKPEKNWPWALNEPELYSELQFSKYLTEDREAASKKAFQMFEIIDKNRDMFE